MDVKHEINDLLELSRGLSKVDRNKLIMAMSNKDMIEIDDIMLITINEIFNGKELFSDSFNYICTKVKNSFKEEGYENEVVVDKTLRWFKRLVKDKDSFCHTFNKYYNKCDCVIARSNLSDYMTKLRMVKYDHIDKLNIKLFD